VRASAGEAEGLLDHGKKLEELFRKSINLGILAREKAIRFLEAD
jgi:hypothetical protein